LHAPLDDDRRSPGDGEDDGGHDGAPGGKPAADGTRGGHRHDDKGARR
ncbi:hypothetical protein G3I38_11545, partial [Streptomyces sp. SID7958]|nr:hypothetical protein [Streptomyces sp. SID7958]